MVEQVSGWRPAKAGVSRVPITLLIAPKIAISDGGGAAAQLPGTEGATWEAQP